MKLTKEDYMKLPKERLAELLVEMQEAKIDTLTIPVMPTTPFGWGCDGIHCTNPQMDCINCPRKTSGGVYITSPNTATGASTLKAEGNTSFTDGKEHNPSFIP